MDEMKLVKEVEELIKAAKKRGSITEGEIGEALIEYDLTKQQLKNVIEEFRREGVTVEDDDESLMKDIDLKDIITSIKLDDPVKMYLKDIGSVDGVREWRR